MAAALSPVVGEKLAKVRFAKGTIHSYGDRTQSSKLESASGVIHRLLARAQSRARTSPVNNSGAPIRDDVVPGRSAAFMPLRHTISSVAEYEGTRYLVSQ